MAWACEEVKTASLLKPLHSWDEEQGFLTVKNNGVYPQNTDIHIYYLMQKQMSKNIDDVLFFSNTMTPPSGHTAVLHVKDISVETNTSKHLCFPHSEYFYLVLVY